MDVRDYAFIKPANWTKEEERLLFEYVLENGIADNCIDWSKIKYVFPGRTLAQCSSKLFRMRQETDKFNFRREIRRIKKQQREPRRLPVFQQKISIDILIGVLRDMGLNGPSD